MSSEAIGLAIINSFLVSIIAGAAHDYIVSPTKSKAQTTHLRMQFSYFNWARDFLC